MSSPAYEIAQYLANSGYGVWAATNPQDWSINVNVEPEIPDLTITLRDDGGSEPDTDELDIQELQMMVRIRSSRRGAEYLVAYQKAEEIRDALIYVAPLVLGDLYIVGIRMVNAITNLGRDQSDRHILSMTFMVQVDRVSPDEYVAPAPPPPFDPLDLSPQIYAIAPASGANSDPLTQVANLGSLGGHFAGTATLGVGGGLRWIQSDGVTDEMSIPFFPAGGSLYVALCFAPQRETGSPDDFAREISIGKLGFEDYNDPAYAAFSRAQSGDVSNWATANNSLNSSSVNLPNDTAAVVEFWWEGGLAHIAKNGVEAPTQSITPNFAAELMVLFNDIAAGANFCKSQLFGVFGRYGAPPSSSQRAQLVTALGALGGLTL